MNQQCTGGLPRQFWVEKPADSAYLLGVNVILFTKQLDMFSAVDIEAGWA